MLSVCLLSAFVRCLWTLYLHDQTSELYNLSPLNRKGRNTTQQSSTDNTAFSSSQDAHHFRRTCLCKTRPRILFAVVYQLSKQFRLQLFPSTLILSIPVHESDFTHASNPTVFVFLNLTLVVHFFSLAVTDKKKN